MIKFVFSVDFLQNLRYTIYRTNVSIMEDEMKFYLNDNTESLQVYIPLTFLNLDSFLNVQKYFILAFYQLPENVALNMFHTLRRDIDYDAHLYIIFNGNQYFLCVSDEYIEQDNLEQKLKQSYQIINGLDIINAIDELDFDK